VQNYEVPPLDQLRRLQELAVILDVSAESLKRWRKSKIHPLSCWRVGNSWRTTEDENRGFILRRTEPGNLDGTMEPPVWRSNADRRSAAARAAAELKAMGC
jgi:hypothetical protein